MKSSRRADALVILALLLLPLLWFAPQALGDKTLLPADNLYQYEPWRSFASQQGLTVADGKVVPYNHLISDLVLENVQWKSVIVDALKAGRPADLLWNPRSFAGTPFFAAGQHSAAYPLSLLFYVMPLWQAYGVFTWLQIGLAAACMYIFMRTLGLRPVSGALSAIAYSFAGFFIVSVNFTMVIAAAAWLPLLLACVEMVARTRGASAAPYVAVGAAVLAVQIYAGHVEITYYTLMVTGLYAAWRLAWRWVTMRRSGMPAGRVTAGAAGWLAAMIALGLALGGAQILPLYELVQQSFREGSASLEQVRNWAWPSRQIITFVLPDFFGNPTHHEYFDIWRRSWVAVTQNALGQPLHTIDWGVKNYVEGGNYLGLGTLALALVGAVAGLMGWGDKARKSVTWFFAVLAVLSLLFAFGTPLYAVLYYGLPGYSQLHSAFRWVFPYTLAMAALAGFGLEWLLARPTKGLWAPRVLGGLLAILGGLSLVVVLVSTAQPAPFIALGERLLHWGFWSDLALSKGFADGAMFWSYEATQLARFGLVALLTGIALLLLAGVRLRTTSGNRTAWFYALPLLVILTLDLWLVGRGFNPAVNPELLSFTPPSIEFLQGKQDASQPWRLTSVDPPDQKVLNANSAMRYGLEDVRGYDSIIPKQYVAYMQRIHPQGELLYNRIAPIYSQLGDKSNLGTLDNPLLNLLGVRYVVSTQPIPNEGYRLVYDSEVKVYENTRAFPRAFVVDRAETAADQAGALDLLQQIDPAETVVIEGYQGDTLPPPASPELREARLSQGEENQRENRQFFVDLNLSDRGWLVVTDSFADGWRAYLRPFGASGEGVDESGQSVEEQLPIYRADGAFRAVYIPAAGQWTVRFVYSPRSFLMGGYLTFLAAVTLILLLGWWAWGRYYKGEGSEVDTVAKNSAVQVVMSLFNRVIDFVFAMLRLRVLSPEGEGSYVFAITFYMIAEIVTRFGLGTLLTRDVAATKTRARTYLANAILLRTGLWLVAIPVAALVLRFFQLSSNPPSSAEIQTIALFMLALFFANIADAQSSIFMAFEKMEYPASTATTVTVAKVFLGGLVLLPPFNLGFVGLAGVAVVMNIFQTLWLWMLLERKVLRPAERAGLSAAEETRAAHAPVEPSPRVVESAEPTPNVTDQAAETEPTGVKRFDWQLQRYMLRESGPLMINHLLATVFWRVSQLVLWWAAGAAAVGIFSAGIKYIDGLNVIPAYFTAAIFPMMSRYAQTGRESMLKAYRLALQLLLMAALPIAVAFTFAATPLIRILGGAAYLPDSAIALRIMIWSIPIGFLNSVTQYVLIAVGQQRFLTRAFMIAVAWTALSNVLLVPRFGAIAAAALLIPAELSLFVPFWWAVRRHVGPISWTGMLARPVLATIANVAIVWGLEQLGLPLIVSLPAGFVAYAILLFVLGAFRSDEFAVLRNNLNRRLHRAAAEPTG